MLTNSEEHRKVFPEPPLIAFRRCKNLKVILVRARLSNEGKGGTDKKGCCHCGKSRCQVCNVMSNSEHFHSNIDSREYRINYSFNCDSSDVVYLLECTVCGVQYVGSTCTPFRLTVGLIITRRAVVSLIRGPQYPRWNSLGILLKKATTGF